LQAHLEAHYGIEVRGIAELDAGVFRIDRADGPSWVARVFPPARPRDRLLGDADVLRLVQRHGIPAERCAHPSPVSAYDDQGVLVTTFVDGTPGRNDPAALRGLGETLGALHTLPATGRAARGAGSLHHWSAREGPPAAELDAAQGWLRAVADRVPPAHAGLHEALSADIHSADRLDRLPMGFLHPDLQPANVLSTDDGEAVAIDWTGAGCGPRIAALSVLLYCSVIRGPMDPGDRPALDNVEPVIEGYSARVHLERDELDRLASAIRIRPLVFAAFLFHLGINANGSPVTAGDWPAVRDLTDQISARAREAFRTA
jgi:Ser/Thr protein kinase RdoA (MazF antagonist)